MISSSVGSGLPGKYSHEIRREYLSGRANLSGKIISIKHNHQSNLGFFSNSDFPSRINSDFLRTALFLEKLLIYTFQSNYFDATVTFSEQLFLQTSCFFKELLFQNSHFVAVVISEQLLFQSKNLQSKRFLRIGSYLLMKLIFE